MCTFTLHEQFCRHCQKVINSDRLNVQTCQGKRQEMNGIRKQIEGLALILNPPAAVASSSNQDKGKGRDTTPPPMPQSMSELQILPRVPSPKSRVRGVNKWLQRQEQGNQAQAQYSHFASGACTAGPGPSSTAFRRRNAPPLTPMPSPFYTPQKSTGTPSKRKAQSLEDEDEDATQPITPPSAKRHRRAMRQAGRDSAAPGPPDAPVFDFKGLNFPIPPPRRPVPMDMDMPSYNEQVDNDGDSDMGIAEGLVVDCQMSDVDSFGSEIDLDGDINISDPVYEDAEQQDEVDDDDKSEEMELECIPRQVGVLMPGWGVCDGCARL
ncbi:hypothetical protein V8F06_012690 [Rhypophila decipiens]